MSCLLSRIGSGSFSWNILDKIREIDDKLVWKLRRLESITIHTYIYYICMWTNVYVYRIYIWLRDVKKWWKYKYVYVTRWSRKWEIMLIIIVQCGKKLPNDERAAYIHTVCMSEAWWVWACEQWGIPTPQRTWFLPVSAAVGPGILMFLLCRDDSIFMCLRGIIISILLFVC